ncbi:MAG TPA: YceI family protein [Steroidobacter sp.]|nr:YceI family protein [Steroidobacter sp.]
MQKMIRPSATATFGVCGMLALAACSSHEDASPAARSQGPAAAASPPAKTVQTDAPAGSYTLDKAHASLLFRVDHLGFSNYTARFKRFDAQLQFDPANFSASSVSVQIDPASIETDFPNPATLDFNAQLRGKEWLDTTQFPQMLFRSSSVELTGSNAMRVNGELTLHGVTRPVAFEATFNGGYAGHPMDPRARIGFSARGALNRSEFAMGFGVPEPGSKMGVSDEVEFIIEAEFNGPPLAAAQAASQAQ